MKDIQELKRDFSAAKSARLRGKERAAALKNVYGETRTLELHVAMNPGFLGFYEVGEMRKFIGELQKAMGL